jgi:orotidine-5'-phosphate decarboxylase
MTSGATKDMESDTARATGETRESFGDRLAAAAVRTGTPALVGIDPHPDLLPDEYAVVRDTNAPREERAEAMCAFCLELVDVAAGRVPAVKPQSAFFELLGSDGVRAMERVVRASRDAGLLVIGDVKRSDIASTARAYAAAYLEGAGRPDEACDAVTLNPYLGTESIEPFLEVCAEQDAGAYVLVRTSNPGSAELQGHGSPPLAEVVLSAVRGWGEGLVGASGWSSIGVVVGATHPEELARLRALAPTTPFLLPGYGAQGAGASDIVGAFDTDGTRPRLGAGLVNSSRGISFAYRKAAPGTAWKDASRAALDAMLADLAAALGTGTG